MGLKVGNNVGLGTHGYFGCAGGVKIGNDTIFGNSNQKARGNP